MTPSVKVASKSVKKISKDVINTDKNLSAKVPAKPVYKISEGVINTEQNQYQCVSSIHGNSGFVFYQIYFSSYSLEIINTLNPLPT